MKSESEAIVNVTRGYGATGGTGGNSEPGGAVLITRELDKNALLRARRLLIGAAVVILLVAIGQFIGGVYAYSLCVFVNTTSYLVIFSRLLFLAFLLHCAGRPTSRLADYRNHKKEINISLLMILIAWMIVGGALFLSVVDYLNDSYGYSNWLVYVITTGIGLVFALLVTIVLWHGRRVAASTSANIRGRNIIDNSPSPSGTKSIVGELKSYGRERGLLLRRTLKHVPMQPYTWMTIWFVLQCTVAFVGGWLVYYDSEMFYWVDIVLAFAFVPLTIVSSSLLLADIINVMTEGILQGVDFSEVTESLLGIHGVTGVKHLRIWALSMDRVSLSVVLSIDAGVADVDDVLNKASALLKAKYDVFEYKVDTETHGGGRRPPANLHRIF